MATINERDRRENRQLPLLSRLNPRQFNFYFDSGGKDFGMATASWLADRAGVLPMIQGSNGKIVVEDTVLLNIQDAPVLEFSSSVLSERFGQMTGLANWAEHIIIWSEGKPVTIQNAKIRTVKREWNYTGGNRLTEMLGEDKMKMVGEITGLKDSHSRMLSTAEGYTDLPLLIVEDKFTNMMKFMREYMVKSPKLSGDPLFNLPIFMMHEDDLDKPDLDVDALTGMWKDVIRKNPAFFRSMRFLYCPPEKQLGEAGAMHMSAERDGRVRAFIKAGNEALAELFGPNYTEQDTGFPHNESGFYHIDDLTPEDYIAENAVLVLDMDGPLVSQQKTLEMFDTLLSQRLMEELDVFYERTFGMDFRTFVRFFSDSSINRYIRCFQDDPDRYDQLVTKTEIEKPPIRVSPGAFRNPDGSLIWAPTHNAPVSYNRGSSHRIVRVHNTLNSTDKDTFMYDIAAFRNAVDSFDEKNYVFSDIRELEIRENGEDSDVVYTLRQYRTATAPDGRFKFQVINHRSGQFIEYHLSSAIESENFLSQIQKNLNILDTLQRDRRFRRKD